MESRGAHREDAGTRICSSGLRGYRTPRPSGDPTEIPVEGRLEAFLFDTGRAARMVSFEEMSRRRRSVNFPGGDQGTFPSGSRAPPGGQELAVLKGEER
jgi:hypothetical protein